MVYGDRGMLRVDKILIGGSDKPSWYDSGETIFDFGAVLATGGDVPSGEAYSEGFVRAVKVKGADGRDYAVAANFGNENFCGMIFGNEISLAPGGYSFLRL